MKRIEFNEEKHTYTDKKLNCKYISVTQLLSKYENPFDTDYWSKYKAIKDVLEKYSLWYDYKKRAGGWEEVVSYYNEFGLGDGYENISGEVLNRIQYYIDSWEKAKTDGLATGTKLHKKKEEELLNQGVVVEKDKEFICYQGNDNDIDIFQGIDEGVFVELLMYNAEYKLAGQADYIKKVGNDVWIYDYKTDKKITDEPFMDKRFKAPIDSLFDTSKNHYMMQLSIYGWMLEQRGFNVKGLEIIHLDRKTGDVKQKIKLEYRKDLVELILKDYSDGKF
jgi:hypothetical protein